MHEIETSFVRRKRAKQVTYIGDFTITRARILLLAVALPLLVANFLVPYSHYTVGGGYFLGDGTIAISVSPRQGYVPLWRDVEQRSVDWERTFGQASVIFSLFAVAWVFAGRSRKRRRLAVTQRAGHTTGPKKTIPPAASREARADEPILRGTQETRS